MRAMGKWGLQGSAMSIEGVKSDAVKLAVQYVCFREIRDEKRGRKFGRSEKKQKKNGDTALYVGRRCDGSDSRQ